MTADKPHDPPDNEDDWEEVPVSGPRSRRLGTQISIRLDEKYAASLRTIAQREGVGYTSLVRSWIEDRIDGEMCKRMTPPVHIAPGAGDSRIGEVVQIGGNGRLVTRPTP